MALKLCFGVSLFLLFSFSAHAQELNIDLANKIMMCESRGNPLAVNYQDAKITGYASKGLFQFQPRTFLLAGIRFKIFPEGTTLTEAMKYIYRPEYQGAIAHGLMAQGEYFHWKNCYLKSV
jgi:hypothetical protein